MFLQTNVSDGGQGMKALKLILTGMAIVISLVIGIFDGNAEASNYLGEFCWQVSSNGNAWGTVRLGVTDMGGNQYLTIGRIDHYDGNIQIINGNAEAKGNDIMVTLNHSSKNSSTMMSGIDQVVLDMNTLNGTFDIIMTVYNYSNKSTSNSFLTGALTYIPCP